MPNLKIYTYLASAEIFIFSEFQKFLNFLISEIAEFLNVTMLLFCVHSSIRHHNLANCITTQNSAEKQTLESRWDSEDHLLILTCH